MKCLLVSVLVFINLGIGSPSFCYWNSGCPYKYFSSKTPYNFVRGDIRDSIIHIKGCEPIGIWGLFRHGKRNPSLTFSSLMEAAITIRKNIIENHAAGKSSLCAQDVENLKNWKRVERSFAEFDVLTDEGYKDMSDIGKRLRQAFPKLLGSLEEGSYIIEPVPGGRVEDSAKAFIKGFNNDKIKYRKPRKGFNEFSPYEKCKNHKIDVLDNPSLYAESEKFQRTPEYLAAKDRIMRRSGIDMDLNDDNITALYDLCRYDSSGYEKWFSPWCSLFTTEDLKVLEYIGDLRHYYRNGYGMWMADSFGRYPLNELLKSFKQIKEGNGTKLTVIISHASMLDMIYTTLGLFKDKAPITGKHRNSDRKWRTSYLSTFSANLMAVLQRCTKNDLDEYNVIFYLNEEPLFSICQDRICTWQEFEEKLTYDTINHDFCEK